MEALILGRDAGRPYHAAAHRRHAGIEPPRRIDDARLEMKEAAN
jgi:hypothetical protein